MKQASRTSVAEFRKIGVQLQPSAVFVELSPGAPEVKGRGSLSFDGEGWSINPTGEDGKPDTSSAIWKKERGGTGSAEVYLQGVTPNSWYGLSITFGCQPGTPIPPHVQTTVPKSIWGDRTPKNAFNQPQSPPPFDTIITTYPGLQLRPFTGAVGTRPSILLDGSWHFGGANFPGGGPQQPEVLVTVLAMNDSDWVNITISPVDLDAWWMDSFSAHSVPEPT